MKICLVVAASVVCTFSQIAWAKTPITARTVGAVSSAVHFCGQIDPRHKEQLSKAAERLMMGWSSRSLAQVKHTAEFEDGYTVMDGVVHELSMDRAVQLCAAAVGQAGTEPARARGPEPARARGPSR